MSDPSLYSIRMRASARSRHLSGAERIVPLDSVDDAVRTCLQRAWSKTIVPDTISVTIDQLDAGDLHEVRALDLYDLRISGVDACRSAALSVLQKIGVSPEASAKAVRQFDQGPSAAGGAMRGAMIMDARTGERLEPDRDRGIRASRFDWSNEASKRIAQALERLGLTHFRTREALALATKAALAPGMVAELCWSDDEDYVAGYVASSSCGYVRLPHLKACGALSGGRAFFVDRNSFDLQAFTDHLMVRPVIITVIGSVEAGSDLESILRGM